MTAPSSTGRRPRLSRGIVLAAALALVDAEGLDALTMRRLGQELDRDPMALYRYAENRAALLDGVAETVLAELVIDADGAAWRTQLRRTVTRPLATPLGLRPAGTLRPLEQLLGLLVGAGFAPDRALHVYRAYVGLLNGHVLNELQQVLVDPLATDALLRLGLDRLPAEEFPHIRGLAEELLAGYDGAAELDVLLDVLLDGLHVERAGR